MYSFFTMTFQLQLHYIQLAINLSIFTHEILHSVLFKQDPNLYLQVFHAPWRSLRHF